MKIKPSTRYSRPSTGLIYSALYAILLPALLLSLTVHLSLAGPAQATDSIEILQTFDYPKASTNTFPSGINDFGTIVGNIASTEHPDRGAGFLRRNNGHFDGPINEPDASIGTTASNGINNANVICGHYKDSVQGFGHGYFFSKQGGFVNFDVHGSYFNALFGINDAGDFCGYYTSFYGVAFASIGGRTITIDLPNEPPSTAYDINNLGEVVGDYILNISDSTVIHGFYRDSNGNVTAPLDIPSAVYSIPRGINDQGLIVGSFSFGDRFQGFAMKLPDTILIFSGSGVDTALTGVNNDGLICGYDYDPVAKKYHGIIGRLR